MSNDDNKLSRRNATDHGNIHINVEDIFEIAGIGKNHK